MRVIIQNGLIQPDLPRQIKRFQFGQRYPHACSHTYPIHCTIRHNLYTLYNRGKNNIILFKEDSIFHAAKQEIKSQIFSPCNHPCICSGQFCTGHSTYTSNLYALWANNCLDSLFISMYTLQGVGVPVLSITFWQGSYINRRLYGTDMALKEY